MVGVAQWTEVVVGVAEWTEVVAEWTEVVGVGVAAG